jgi:hypothetical protein
MTYSFSTAAAKVGGQSTAPDQRIRDSYRTDTLTPLARPPNRFRKTGIRALASNRGVDRFYHDKEQDVRPQSRRRPNTGRRRMEDDLQFRSSPPPQTQRIHSHQKRRRPREFEDDAVVIREDEVPAQSPLGKDDSVMEIDDETRAAVRMSIFGPNLPTPLQTPTEERQELELKELSPNVMQTRKTTRQPTKKRRRPSYWDGDLKQIRESPAGRSGQRVSGTSDREAVTNPPDAMVQHGGPERRVCTSPAQEDIENVEEHSGVISFDEKSVETVIRRESGMSSVIREATIDVVMEQSSMEVDTA